MSNYIKKVFEDNNLVLDYYEIETNLQPLVLIHGEGVSAATFQTLFKRLSKKYHIYAINCFGHGGSTKNPELYNIKTIGDSLIKLIEKTIDSKVYLLGHSSGGLIASYIASKSNLCEQLILEDVPFFISQDDERLKKTFQYNDLYQNCHNFINQNQETDFPLYHFKNQYAWTLFDEKAKGKYMEKLISRAIKYRAKNPTKNLKVKSWPISGLSIYEGMNNFDPVFGESFFTKSFHGDINHEDILKNIKCPTTFLKAQSVTDDHGVTFTALSEQDLGKVCELIPQCETIKYACGHFIHIEKTKDYIKFLLSL